MTLNEYPFTELLNYKDYPEFAPLVSRLFYFVLLFAVVKLQEVRTKENRKFSAFYIESAANPFFLIAGVELVAKRLSDVKSFPSLIM